MIGGGGGLILTLLVLVLVVWPLIKVFPDWHDTVGLNRRARREENRRKVWSWIVVRFALIMLFGALLLAGCFSVVVNT